MTAARLEPSARLGPIAAAAAAAWVALALPTAAARAAPAGPSIVAANGSIPLAVGSGRLVRVGRAVGSVFVADPAIADVQTPNPASLFVFGKKPGRTTLFALAPDGRPLLAETVVVTPEDAALDAGIAGVDGGAARNSGTVTGTVLQGRAASPEVAANLVDLARHDGGGDVLDAMRVTSPIQVNLRVRVAEVSRSVSRTLGFNWNTILNAGSFHVGIQTVSTNPLATAAPDVGVPTLAGSAGTGIDQIFGSVASRVATGSLTLDAMADEGLVTLLAEPNLTTTSGEPATFLAGGEYPIPVPQGLGTVAIEFKQYGVSVGFTPTVLSTGMISMKISPEVSELSATGATVIDGITIPALITRRAQTTIEVGSGQSFAIAGLLQSDADNDVHKIPWLGDVPILGALFRSTHFQRDQTELVIAVTAFVVRPTDRAPDLPTDFVRQTSDFERLVIGRTLARRGGAAPAPSTHLRGSAGFLFE